MSIDFDRVTAGRISVVVGAQPASAEREVMDRLIERVRNFWIEGVLEAAVPRGSPVPLLKSYVPDAVRHPLDEVARRARPRDAPELGDAPMARVFDQSERLLLVLGEPGGGKTISLLELARELNDRAENDPREPVAVVFSLSTWARRRKGLLEWLVEELATRYYVSRAGARACLEKQQLVLLLDGLDEVEPSARAACVEAVYHFARETGVAGLAITCRLEEFRGLGGPLALNAAVCLHPFGHDQIDAYLGAAGVAPGPFRDVLRREGELRRLASSPLMLYVITRAFAARPGDLWSLTHDASPGSLPDALFAAYVAEVHGRHPAAEGGLAPERMDRVLAWVGANLNRHSQTELAVEQLQPSWLAGRGQQWAYLAASRIVTGALAVLAVGVLYGLLFTLPAGVVAAVRAAERPERSVATSVLELAAVTGMAALFGALAGGVAAVVDGVRYEWGRGRPPPRGGVLRGLACLAAYTLLGTALFVPFRPIDGACLGMLAGVVLGARTLDRSLADDIRTVEVLSLSARGAWTGLLVALRWWAAAGGVVLALCLAVAMLFGVEPLGMVVTLVFLVVLSFPLALVAGVGLGAVRGGRLKTRSRPNQGIRRSVRSAALAATVIGIVTVVLGTVVGVAALHLVDDSAGLREAWSVAVTFAMGIAVVAALWNGGIEVVRHYTLRAVIAASGAAPFRLVAVLDRAAQSILLQKVGGDYRFLHRNLQDYFAARFPSAPAVSPGRPTDASVTAPAVAGA